MSIRTALLTGLAFGVLVSAEVRAQGRVDPPPTVDSGPVRVAPGPRYDAGPIQRFLLGSGWRDLWLRPLELRPLPIDTFAGGLTPEREGGNMQSITLHLIDAQGGGWVFRSLDKYPSDKLMEGLGGTLTGSAIQDQVSALHPAGQFMLPPLLEAIGVLHVEPLLFVMPDDPRLGEFRETFAGMIGALERKPNEGENDTPGFAGSRKIRDTKDFMDDLEESPQHELAVRELLRARFLDFMIGDTDRGTDQYNWARFPHPDDSDRYLWRPIPRDRDWAFLRPGGIIVGFSASAILPKFTAFGPDPSPVKAHAFSSHAVDRRLLAALDREAFLEEATAMQAMVTDAVIAESVARLPDSYPESHARWVAESLRSRRNQLPDIAEAYYEELAGDVSVHMTDIDEYARIERRGDGSLEVAVYARQPITDGNGGPGPYSAQTATPHYQRVFLPSETEEVRLFLHGGDDVAVVRGAGSPITVRVIGGGSDDVLADSSGTGRVHFYDSEGDNRIEGTPDTFNDDEWEEPPFTEGIRLGGTQWAPDWGSNRGWSADLDHGTGAGIVVGFGPSFTNYGFRRIPWHWRFDARAHTGLSEFTPGISLALDYRFEAAPHSIEVEASWPGYESFRWFGMGNDTERLPREEALVRMERLEIESALVWRFGEWRMALNEEGDTTRVERSDMLPPRGFISVGPLFRRSRTDPAPDGLFATTRPLGFEPLWQVGSRVEVEYRRTDSFVVPQRGYRAEASLEGWPGALDLPGAYGRATGEVAGYVPLIGDLHFATRMGAITSFGDVPAFDVAALGGRRTLRGHSSRRFAGDVAAYGGVEFRVPLGNFAFIAPGKFGAFALVDAGRVWNNGESSGGWHTAYGGGLWFSMLERAVSAAWAQGERGTLHVWVGLPY